MLMSQVKQGERVRIIDLSKTAPMIKKRLLHMGLLEGSEVLVINKMLFGGPFMLEINGNRVALRREDVTTIEVERVK